MKIRQFGNAALVVVTGFVLLASACDTKETIVEEDFNFDGTCINCHDGLSSGQVHATFKLRCVDCHGGDDLAEIPEFAFEDEAVYRDPDLIASAHVAPKPGLARFFFANGMDDDGDGLVDETIEFDDTFAPTEVIDFGEIFEGGLQGQGAGEFVDSEYNRDLNYVRWLNPGDLRVATIGCGSKSRPALDGEAGGVCHQDVVEISRRSIMVNNAAVINGAMYGNQSWRPTFFNARDNPNVAGDPRKGAFGYTLDYVGVDDCIDESGTVGNERGQAVFDSACLEARAAQQDPNAATGASGNVGLPAFEIAQGKIVGSAPGTVADSTFAYSGAGPLSRYEWGGGLVKDPEAILDEIEFVPDETLATPFAVVPDPVDNILRGFRAYYPMNYIGSTGNFFFSFGASILPEIAQFQTNNPFGRGHSSGCTSCHMKYDFTGNREPQIIEELDPDTGLLNTFVVEDPTTKHREFNPDEDIININGVDLLIGSTINRKERIEAVLGRFDALNPFNEQQENQALAQRPQQRYYSKNHTIDTRIDTDNCGLCHAFVTRIDFSYQGFAEDEQRDRLARHRAIEFTTPRGTNVTIHDSWVREEDELLTGTKTLVVPEGENVAQRAIERNEDIEAQSREQCGDIGVLLPGAGGCGQSVFTEDCNNNGELDESVTLSRVDEDGNVLCEITIDEDDNNNGRLDLTSHVPRRFSIDGRQPRYVYGGANGSTRLMDIHFERGMHCIDCHMLQDTHGDGNIYSTNWEQIEIECEDCHGAKNADGAMVKATLFTSGANGVNDLRNAVDHDRRPFFEDQGDRIIQRSRVTPGLFWDVPQMSGVSDPGSPDFDPDAIDAHIPEHVAEISDPDDPEKRFTIGSEFAGEPGRSELTFGVLECWTCHTSWIHNCVGCHYNMNLGNTVKKLVEVDGTLTDVAGENETWFNNKNQAGRTNFQLLEFMRSPFVMAYTAAADSQRVGLFRSNMIVQVSVFGGDGAGLVQDMNFTTFNDLDANSGRQNVATSGSAMNQHMPHTVRPLETRSCEQCHSLVDGQNRVQNDHILAETYGLGAGRLTFVGNHAFVAGTPDAGAAGIISGLEAVDFKQENQLAGSNVGTNPINRFPGIILNPAAADRVAANVEPPFNAELSGFTASDAVLIRNFNATPAVVGGTQAPTLQDVVLMSVTNGANQGAVAMTTVTLRSNPAASPAVGDARELLALGAGPARALAHIGSDVSDPFLYVAQDTAGLTVVEILNAPSAGNDMNLVTTVGIPGGRAATEVTTAGDIAYVGTADGTIEVFDLANPRQPVHRGSVLVDPGANEVTGIEIGGFHMYASTDGGGLVVADISDPFNPVQASGANSFLLVSGFNALELSFSGGHVYLAAGLDGVRDIDVSVPAAPVDLGDIIDTVSNEAVDAQDVIFHAAAGPQYWLLIADINGDMVGVKLDTTQSTRERCLTGAPNPCGLDMDWRDPTIMGRDPGFDARVNQFFPANVDPSGPPFFRMVTQNLQTARRIARPIVWEKLGTHTGRRYRDSFMPGSGVLSLQVMQNMYNLQVCVEPGSEDINGNGLGRIGLVENGCVPASEPASDESLTCEADFSNDTGASCEVPDASEMASPFDG